MAYCVLNYHQKSSNGAYIGGHSTMQSNAAAAAAAASDPTTVLQSEMRSLSTKDHYHHSHHHTSQQQQQYLSTHQASSQLAHPSYQHSTLHSRSHPSHHHQPVHPPPHQHIHHLHPHTQSAQLLSPPPHRHASISSLNTNTSCSLSGFSEQQSQPKQATTSRTLPRNRRRSTASTGSAQFGSDRSGNFEMNNSKRYSFNNNYNANGKNESRQSNQSRGRHDSRRGSAASSLRSTSPSSASSVSSSSSISAANTRSPSPQANVVESGTCQRIPSLLNSVSDADTSLTTTSANGNKHGYGNSSSQAQQVLLYDQVLRLHQVMEQVVPIHGRGNFPTLDIKLKTLVKVVRNKLENAQPPVKVRDIRLNGGAASHVLAPETGGYNDLDLIFAVDLPDQTAYDRVRTAVMDSLLEFLPDGVNRTRLSSTSLKEAYIHKMVKVTDQDRWSLISLSNNLGRNVELKFVDTMKRQFEFSVDSFHIILDSLLLFYECSQLPISTNIYPTVIGESVYGDFAQALQHLKDKLIATRNPEQIRGGGLLKYCNLLIRGYRSAEPENIKSLERYMCSRFFIDFNEIGQQRAKLESYLANHFIGDDLTRTQYLIQLHKVVDDSTVCLMGYERRQTLNLIEELASNIYYQMQQSQAGSISPRVMLSSNFKHPFMHQHHLHQQQPQQQVLLSPVGRFELSSITSDQRSGSPSIDSQSNADSTEQESNEAIASGELCNLPNCACAAQAICTPAAIPQYHAYLLGNASNHFYYTAHFQNGYGCYNSCHCGNGGWMTCA